MEIPAIETAQGVLSRVIAIRIKPGTDFLEGLYEICERHGIKNGLLLSCIGSLKDVQFCNPVEMPHRKAGYGYGDGMRLSGPIELDSATGVICHDDQGQRNLHIHVTLSDRSGKAYAGHLLEGATVLLNVDAVIGEIGGVEMLRRYDPEMEVPRLSPRQA